MSEQRSLERVERIDHLVRRMNEVERNLTGPYVRPKDAGTLVLVDRSGRVPKVLLGKRHAGHVFMPGKYVFPGGRVDRADARMPVAHPLAREIEALLMQRVRRPSPARARALALAAIRETFEETGIILGVRADEPVIAPQGPWSAFARAKVLPDLSALHLIGRAITPPGRPRRFDARFFMMDASSIAHCLEGVTGPDAELIELVWMPIDDAAHLDVPTVTRVMLEELDLRIAAGFRQDIPVPFYRMPRGRFLREILSEGLVHA
jgi:8-oxo-dGTP pyrophosphatase MutT (NUDIX family)